MRRRPSRSGQAMVELAILLPFMMLLFLGSWTAADLIGDNDTALQATRAGARYAAELGDTLPVGGVTALVCSGVGVSDPNTCQVDQDIISQVLPVVAGNMPNAVINEIDIYQPTSCTNGGLFTSGTPDTSSGCPPNNGAYIPHSTELIDSYPISGATAQTPTSLAYGLGERYQNHPDESELGVRIVFTYKSPTLSIFSQTDSQYTVVRLAPLE